MALIICAECGKEISDRAESCPNCGCPVGEKKDNVYENYQDGEPTEEVDNIECGIISLILSVAGIVLTFIINGGFLLIFPLMIFIISIILSRKCYKWFSTVGFAISGLGSVLIVFEVIKNIVFMFS